MYRAESNALAGRGDGGRNAWLAAHGGPRGGPRGVRRMGVKREAQAVEAEGRKATARARQTGPPRDEYNELQGALKRGGLGPPSSAMSSRAGSGASTHPPPQPPPSASAAAQTALVDLDRSSNAYGPALHNACPTPTAQDRRLTSRTDSKTATCGNAAISPPQRDRPPTPRHALVKRHPAGPCTSHAEKPMHNHNLPESRPAGAPGAGLPAVRRAGPVERQRRLRNQ